MKATELIGSVLPVTRARAFTLAARPTTELRHDLRRCRPARLHRRTTCPPRSALVGELLVGADARRHLPQRDVQRAAPVRRVTYLEVIGARSTTAAAHGPAVAARPPDRHGGVVLLPRDRSTRSSPSGSPGSSAATAPRCRVVDPTVRRQWRLTCRHLDGLVRMARSPSPARPVRIHRCRPRPGPLELRGPRPDLDSASHSGGRRSTCSSPADPSAAVGLIGDACHRAIPRPAQSGDRDTRRGHADKLSISSSTIESGVRGCMNTRRPTGSPR